MRARTHPCKRCYQLQDLKIGLKEKYILQQFRAYDAWTSCTDLEKICDDFLTRKGMRREQKLAKQEMEDIEKRRQEAAAAAARKGKGKGSLKRKRGARGGEPRSSAYSLSKETFAKYKSYFSVGKPFAPMKGINPMEGRSRTFGGGGGFGGDDDDDGSSSSSSSSSSSTKREQKAVFWSRMAELVGGRPFVIEPKYDGERLQIHKDGDLPLKLFSRNQKDYSDLYGHSLKSDVLDGCHARRCVLDGEVLAWNAECKCWARCGDVKTAAIGSNNGDNSVLQLKFLWCVSLRPHSFLPVPVPVCLAPSLNSTQLNSTGACLCFVLSVSTFCSWKDISTRMGTATRSTSCRRAIPLAFFSTSRCT